MEVSILDGEEELVDVLTEPADNILDLKLICRFLFLEGDGTNASIRKILSVFKKWQHLRSLAFVGDRSVSVTSDLPPTKCPTLKFICHLILGMKRLNNLYIYDDFNDLKMLTLKQGVDDWVKQHRPGFIFEMRNSKTRSSDDSWCSFESISDTSEQLNFEIYH